MRLFDPGPRNPNLRISDLLENAQWHATDRQGWAENIHSAGVPVHSGTARAALERGTGRDVFHPVVPGSPREDTISDRAANAADAMYQAREGKEASLSVRASASGELANPRHVASLEAGESLRYRNEYEDDGSEAFVSPPGGFSTLHDADLGLAEGTGWKPKPYTREQVSKIAEPEQWGSIDVFADPRLFEQTRSGEFYAAADVDVDAIRDEGRIWGSNIFDGGDIRPGARPL
jgi:hypothetical protein